MTEISFMEARQREHIATEIRTFEHRFGQFGDTERRSVGIADVMWRESGSAEPAMTVVGHGSVFDRLSLDLGGFQERIAPGAFEDVLNRTPPIDVHLLWDHDTRYVLARTLNKSLDLKEDPKGLRFWGRVAPTSYAADLRVLMERGDIDQASFAFTVLPQDQEWKIDTDAQGNERVIRTIKRVADLYDVTICAQGAYPASDSSVVRSLAYNYAKSIGRLPSELSLDAEGAARNVASVDSRMGATTVAQDGPAGGDMAKRVLALQTDVRRRRLMVTANEEKI